MNHEDQGTGYDPGAAGHELQGRKPKPIRIQRQRTKGWKMPENTVYVGRPGRWGNPFSIMTGLTAKEAVARYRCEMPDFTREAARRELRGKNLACWCLPGTPCHADVLLEIANG